MEQNNANGQSAGNIISNAVGVFAKLVLFFVRHPYFVIPTLIIFFFLFILFLIVAAVASNEDNGYAKEVDSCQAIEIEITGTRSGKNITLNILGDGDFEIKGIKGTVEDGEFTAEKEMTEEELASLENDNATKIWNFFRTRGYSEAATAGIMGNLHHETAGTLDPSKHQIGGGPGRGLAQWEKGGRFDTLLTFANKRGTRWDDLETQLLFIEKEINEGQIKDPDAFKKLTSIEEATDIFCDEFERPNPASAAKDKRKKYAKDYYNQFHGKLYGDVKLNGTIEKKEIEISGTVGTEDVEAYGTIEDGKIEASGYLGDTTNCGFIGGMGNGQFGWPLKGYGKKDITSEFGSRWGRLHAGIDIGIPIGTDVYAAESGTVTAAGYNGGYGLAVDIKHDDTYTTRYAHNSKLLVSKGEKVKKGQAITKSGNTGNSTGPHLHFEVRVNGTAQNPLKFVEVPD